MKRIIYDWVSSDFYESISAEKLKSLIKSGLRSIESASIYGQLSRTQMLMNTARGIASLKYPLMNMDNQFYVNEIKNYRENCDIESVAEEIRRGHLIPTDYLKVFESIFSQDELPVIFSENEKRFNRFMTQIPTKGKKYKDNTIDHTFNDIILDFINNSSKQKDYAINNEVRCDRQVFWMSIAELLSGVCKFNVDGAYSFNVVGIDRKFNKSNKNYFILDAILKPEGISLNDAKMASVSPYFLYETFVPSYISIKNMMDVMIGVRFVIYKASFDVFMSIGSDTCKSYIAIEKYMHDLIPFLNLPCFVTVLVE